MLHPSLSPRWTECVVAATGPSLTAEAAERCRGLPALAVSDAWRLLPWADVLYSCDVDWWDAHNGCPAFRGEKWSSHGNAARPGVHAHNDKLPAAEKYCLNLVQGRAAEGFSLDPSVIHYGSNSGFQAINLAILFGAKRILLIGFDLKGRGHFFGDHPKGLNRCPDYARFLPPFERAAKLLPEDIRIVNCTPGSALRCFEAMDLHDALSAQP